MSSLRLTGSKYTSWRLMAAGHRLGTERVSDLVNYERMVRLSYVFGEERRGDGFTNCFADSHS